MENRVRQMLTSQSGTGWAYNDGGRAAAGFKGTAGDCVCRAIAIATALPYLTVYNALNALAVSERRSKRRRGWSSARNGVYKVTYRPLLEALGWRWTPTMQIGQGCKVHLRAEELPNGRLIVQVSKHLVAVINGVIHDRTDSYALAFWIGVALSLVSIVTIWLAAPRKVRAVAGQMHRVKATA